MAIKLKPIEEQVIVITGASSGIGLCTAKTAAKQGARVVLAARSENTLDDVVKEIEAAGGQAMSFVVDVADRTRLHELADAAVARFGGIDTWVNDAGVAIYGRLEEVSDDDSRRLFDTNFWGVVYGSLVALPVLRAHGGALINVGSEVSDAVIPYQGMYSASKHAVKGFTDALRLEVEELDEAPVAVTLIQPTAVDTPYPQHARNDMAEEARLPSPMIDPQKVADASLDAATHHRRDVRVGGGAVLDTIAAKVMPSIADKVSAKRADQQKVDAPPRDREGALERPGEQSRAGAGDVHGEDPDQIERDADTHR